MDLDLAQAFAEAIAAIPGWEIRHEVQLSTVCVRILVEALAQAGRES